MSLGQKPIAVSINRDVVSREGLPLPQELRIPAVTFQNGSVLLGSHWPARDCLASFSTDLCMSPQRPVLVMTLAAALLLQLGAGLMVDCCCTTNVRDGEASSVEATKTSIRCPNCRSSRAAADSSPQRTSTTALSDGTTSESRLTPRTCRCSKPDEAQPVTTSRIRVSTDIETFAAILTTSVFEPACTPAPVAIRRHECRPPGIPLRILHCSWQA